MRWLALLALGGVAAADLLVGGVVASPAGTSRTYALTPAEVARIGAEAEAAFRVRVSGQWRTPEEDARRRQETGREAVSDHVAGMALDFVGAPPDLDRLAADLRTRPDVAYVLWRVPLHFDHVHASFR